MTLKGQGVTQLFCGTTCRPGYCLADQTIAPLFALQKEGLRGQGATEYLVLLAVVLVIALVAIALLGFFPGMAGDERVTQSQAYWQSATPIAIIEGSALLATSQHRLYIRIRNTGNYPIRITKIYGNDGGYTSVFWASAGDPCGAPSGNNDIGPYYYLGVGEETYFGTYRNFPGLRCDREIDANAGASGSAFVGGATSLCQNSATAPGMVEIKKFGFEYIQYVEGVQITKRQIGSAPLILKCRA